MIEVESYYQGYDAGWNWGTKVRTFKLSNRCHARLIREDRRHFDGFGINFTRREALGVRHQHEHNIRVSECRLAVEFLHEFAREMNDPNAKAILNLAADNWGRARLRALADRSEPRQEKEGNGDV